MFFEKLADHLGRGIRYGEQPSFGNFNPQGATDLPDLQEIADSAVEMAHLCADLISAIEEEDAQGIIGDEKRERARVKAQRTMAILLEVLDLITATFVGLGKVSE